jgi:hypothetical protein
MRAALGSAAKVAWRRTEVLRLAGRCHWLLGHVGHALRFFDRSADVGERLGARPETARTYADAGRLLCERARSGERFRGLDGAACMARARETFEQLGLGGDLERMAGSTSTHAP